MAAKCPLDISSFDDLMLSEQDKKDLHEQLSKEPKLRLLCGGPTRAGKSTLLNGLMGLDAALKGQFKISDGLEPGTRNVTAKVFVKNGVEVKYWDTPGLQGDEKVDTEYLEEIKANCEHFDLFLYRIDCSQCRANEVTTGNSSLSKFTAVFGVDLWKRAVIVLTFANIVNRGVDGDEQQFLGIIDEWKIVIRRALLNNGVPTKKLEKIPIVPAGFKEHSLPGYRSWLSNIFLAALDRMDTSASLAYLKLTRDHLQSDMDPDPNFAGCDLPSTPLIIRTSVHTGTTIEALITGVPSLGVFAGVRLVAGIWIGAGAGLVKMLAVKLCKKKKLISAQAQNKT